MLHRCFSTQTRHLADFSHIVIGGGVVGAAVASELQQIASNNVVLLEKNTALGMETTSRNSEVIHAGLYYPPSSLKAQFCVRGKELIYSRLDPYLVPFKQCGKWVVAQDETEGEYLEKLRANADSMGVPTRRVSASEARRVHPLIRAEFGALESPTTGIISAHDLTQYFQAQFENAEGTVALQTNVVSIAREGEDYTVACSVVGLEDDFVISGENVINSAGLFAPQIANLILPPERHFKSHFAKGNYFSYTPKQPILTSKITSKLIYPCPRPNASGLGTHLTFDLGGQLRFGPDLEWVDSSLNDASMLLYDVSSNNLEAAHQAISTYFPGIELDEIQPSYSGIRPKLTSHEESLRAFSDFYVEEEPGFPGFVNLIGIESPGLTSAFAIAEHVAEMYHK